jgi:hypothetical protein
VHRRDDEVVAATADFAGARVINRPRTLSGAMRRITPIDRLVHIILAIHQRDTPKLPVTLRIPSRRIRSCREDAVGSRIAKRALVGSIACAGLGAVSAPGLCAAGTSLVVLVQ